MPALHGDEVDGFTESDKTRCISKLSPGCQRLVVQSAATRPEVDAVRTLASWCFRHKWLTTAAWIVGLAVLTSLHSAAGSAFSDNFSLPHTQSFDAIRLLQRNAPRASGETDQLVFGVKTGTVRDPAVRA